LDFWVNRPLIGRLLQPARVMVATGSDAAGGETRRDSRSHRAMRAAADGFCSGFSIIRLSSSSPTRHCGLYIRGLPIYVTGNSSSKSRSGTMRAEIENIVDEIKQAISLLRRHL
jgi:hypothetical protein